MDSPFDTQLHLMPRNINISSKYWTAPQVQAVFTFASPTSALLLSESLSSQRRPTGSTTRRVRLASFALRPLSYSIHVSPHKVDHTVLAGPFHQHLFTGRLRKCLAPSPYKI